MTHTGVGEGQRLYFLNTENCLVFASAEGEDCESKEGVRGRKRGTERGQGPHCIGEWVNVRMFEWLIVA